MFKQLPDRTEEYHKAKVHLAWIFGLVAGLAFVIVGWGFDGLQLSQANGMYPWAKMAVGSLPVLLVCFVAAWLGGVLENRLASFIIWVACGMVTAFIAGHIPFEGLNWFYGWADPSVVVRLHYVVDSGVVTRLALAMGICAAIGAIAGLFFDQLLDNCFASNSTGGAILIVLLWAIFFAASGLTLDRTIEQPLRAPIMALNETINSKLQDEVTSFSLEEERNLYLGSLDSVVDLLHFPRKLILMDYNESLSMIHIGVNFGGTWANCMVAANNYMIPPLQQPVYCNRMN